MVVDGMKQHETGASRVELDDDLRYDLIHPLMLIGIAYVLGRGAKVYGERNWELGLPVADHIKHGIGHATQYMSGDRSEPHLAKAMVNFGMAMVTEILHPHLAETVLGPGFQVTDASRAAIETHKAHPMSPEERERMTWKQIKDLKVVAAMLPSNATPISEFELGEPASR